MFQEGIHHGTYGPDSAGDFFFPAGATMVLTITTPRMVEAYIRAISNIDVDSFGEIHWAVWRRNLDGSEPRHCLSNASEDTFWRRCYVWAAPVDASRRSSRPKGAI